MKQANWQDVLGMNARNALVDAENPTGAVRLVNSKQETKEALERVGVPVPPTERLVRDRMDLASLDWDSLPDSWALKPNRGRGGTGILLAASCDGDGWRTASGRHLGRDLVLDHVLTTLDGEFSLEGAERDAALFEPLIVPHPALADLVPSGLPDVRVICRRSTPLLAMMRLPTEESEGRANLHQGALGAAVDLETGRLVAALHKHGRIEEHPDTGRPLIGVEVPGWRRIVEAATRCASATGLGYLGADVVVDAERGPLVLEVNARPGLEIQNVAGKGLRTLMRKARTDRTDRREAPKWGRTRRKRSARVALLSALLKHL